MHTICNNTPKCSPETQDGQFRKRLSQLAKEWRAEWKCQIIPQESWDDLIHAANNPNEHCPIRP